MRWSYSSDEGLLGLYLPPPPPTDGAAGHGRGVYATLRWPGAIFHEPGSLYDDDSAKIYNLLRHRRDKYDIQTSAYLLFIYMLNWDMSSLMVLTKMISLT